MNKRMIALLGVLVVLLAFAAVMVYGFPERLFVSGSAESIKSVKVSWDFRSRYTVTVTDPQDIDGFFEALAQTSKLRANPFPHHEEGLHSNPVYTLEITYQNGNTEFITTQEGGKHIYRRLNTKTDHGDRGYISAYNEALREWAQDIVTKSLRF